MSGSVCTSFIISPKAQEAYARITTLLLLVQVHLMSVCVSMLKMRRSSHRRVRMMVCCVCRRGPNRWNRETLHLQTGRDHLWRKARKGGPESRVIQPASPRSDTCWRCCSALKSGKTKTICGWRMSRLPWQRMFSFFRAACGAKETEQSTVPTKAQVGS